MSNASRRRAQRAATGSRASRAAGGGSTTDPTFEPPSPRSTPVPGALPSLPGWPAGAAFGLGPDRPLSREPRAPVMARPVDPRRPTQPSYGTSPDTLQRIQHARALRDALECLQQLASARDEARVVVLEHDEQIRVAAAHLRVDGASWSQIRRALGISRQGARQRFDATARAAHRTRDVRIGSTDIGGDEPPTDA